MSMSDEQIEKLKKNIVAIGRLLWEKELASGLNGNISGRVDENHIILTANKTCLGLLHEKDILLVDLEGRPLEPGAVSTETLLHTSIYKNFPEVQAVVHTHTTYTNAYFLENDTLNSRIFESRLYLGQVAAVPQHTPAVTDAAPVIGALKSNSIVALKNHGVVAMGHDLFDCFLLIQSLEEAVKVDAISRLYGGTKKKAAAPKAKRVKKSSAKGGSASGGKAFKLFSPQQIDEIVRIVNHDKQMKELGEKTRMTMDLAVKLNETGQTYQFQFKNGRIANVSQDDGAEFLISAPETVWRAVFNREIDPFVATTQKKMNLKGDFARISQWYAPCSRIFELWQQVPVE